LIPFLLLPFVSAQEIPDYDNPYAPIIFDKQVYSWTDKIRVTIIAPSWNTNQNLIDTIGGDTENPVRISTRTHSLEPYRLSETDPKSGVFVGEIILTGFPHDTNGDGKYDTNPRTFGNGPTSGFLETERDSAITVSFEFAEGVVLNESVPISWNIGSIKIQNKPTQNNEITVQVIDFDLNLNPERIDHIPVKIYSDSDVAGIKVDVIETTENSGIFAGTISITNLESSGNRLHAIAGDAIHARYTDYTLPKPYTISDSIEIEDTLFLESITPSTKSIVNKNFRVTDSFGNELNSISKDMQVQLVGTIVNEQPFSQKFTYLFQTKDNADSVISISWVQGKISQGNTLDVSQSWITPRTGKFSIETFVWKSLSDPIPLSSQLTSTIIVN